MKKFQTTIIIFALFAGLIGYYFLVEKKKPVIVEEEEINIYNFNKDDFKSIELLDMSENIHFLLKKKKNWMIMDPVEMPVSKKTIDGMISELAVLSAYRDVTAERPRYRNFGLSVPRYKIKFSVGTEYHILYVGDINPTNSYYFVKDENKDNIYMVDIAKIDRLIKKNISDLRDKNFMQISEFEIKKLEINIKNSGKFTIEKNKEREWIIANSKKKDMDQEIQNVFVLLSTISVEEFMKKDASNMKDYGLDDPLYKITIYKKKGEAVELNFGKIENNLVYLMGDKRIFRIRRNIIDSIGNLYINMKE